MLKFIADFWSEAVWGLLIASVAILWGAPYTIIGWMVAGALLAVLGNKLVYALLARRKQKETA